jgi:hypothetical protein
VDRAPLRAQHVILSVRIEADADEPTLMELVERADRASEVANALRLGVGRACRRRGLYGAPAGSNAS